MDRTFQVGDRVMKNEATWVASEFDGWGRGVGVGVVVDGPFEVEGEVHVRWPGGRCFERIDGLIRESANG
jgi:hypothetical protein